MLLKPSELAKKASVSKPAVSQWINRSKKIFIDKDGFIDTEDSKNKLFLMKKAPLLYNNNEIPVVSGELNTTKTPSEDNEIHPIIEEYMNLDINNFTLEECRETLHKFINLDPKRMLILAQYRKADKEAKLKELDLHEKINRKFDRDCIESHFMQYFKIMNENCRQIPYSTVDKIMDLVLKDSVSARGVIIELLDNKYIEQVQKTVDLLKQAMQKEYPLGVIPSDKEKLENV